MAGSGFSEPEGGIAIPVIRALRVCVAVVAFNITSLAGSC